MVTNAANAWTAERRGNDLSVSWRGREQHHYPAGDARAVLEAVAGVCGLVVLSEDDLQLEKDIAYCLGYEGKT